MHLLLQCSWSEFLAAPKPFIPYELLLHKLLIYFRTLCTGVALTRSSMIAVEQQIATHNDVAAVLAILSLFGCMGGAVGNFLAGAQLKRTMQRFLRDLVEADWEVVSDVPQVKGLLF
ncbi:hypothetical protein C8R43DRAFT_1130898 [Mycena crocata]|nr:hypothetical protein C8R43DRAFT_1130898 [Mycena crocata]